MATVISPSPTVPLTPAVPDWTAADLVERFGPIPLWRVRMVPAPGTATEQDVIDIHDREKRLCELVDGVLVEKTVGIQESYLALLIGGLINEFLRASALGIALGADGMAKLSTGLIRIPDVSFVRWERFPGRVIPAVPFLESGPDLAVEVLSPSNHGQGDGPEAQGLLLLGRPSGLVRRPGEADGGGLHCGRSVDRPRRGGHARRRRRAPGVRVAAGEGLRGTRAGRAGALSPILPCGGDGRVGSRLSFSIGSRPRSIRYEGIGLSHVNRVKKGPNRVATPRDGGSRSGVGSPGPGAFGRRGRPEISSSQGSRSPRTTRLGSLTPSSGGFTLFWRPTARNSPGGISSTHIPPCISRAG